MITQSELMEILNYDPNTGQFTWKVSRGKAKIGTIAGTYIGNHGYRVININKKLYLTHRLAWLYMTGNWPKEQIDHINGIRIDNCWANLREASRAENSQNLGINKTNKSGYIGVSWDKDRNKWRAHISINKKIIYLGLFDDPYEAHQAYLDAKSRLHTFNPIPR